MVLEISGDIRMSDEPGEKIQSGAEHASDERLHDIPSSPELSDDEHSGRSFDNVTGDTTVVIPTGENQPSEKTKAISRAVGTTIGGHYRLESRIGSGGSSAVFLATDLSLNRKVAVKLLLSGAYFSDEERLRFQREGRAVGSLDHPHIVRIFEFNTTENDEPFLVMEYLEGNSLADKMKAHGKLAAREVLNCAIQVVQALSYAHKRGIVHRDIKSSNIMLVQDSAGELNAKVVDFGLARPEDEAGKGLTLTGTIFGSPHYMSPEQCRGERVDARSDIYSLGCVLYEGLTGHVPFDGASILETFRMHLEESPKPFASKLKDAQNAADIEKVVFKCLAKNPADRYQDAERLEKELLSLEKNARSGLLSTAASTGRQLRSLVLPRSGKLRTPFFIFASILSMGTGVLLLKPQLLTDLADKHWQSLDLQAQQEFDNGSLDLARKKYDDSIVFLQYAPVTQRKLRIKESYGGRLDLAFARADANEKKLFREKLNAMAQDLQKDKHEKPLATKISEMMMAIKSLHSSDDPQIRKSNAQEAVDILNHANDVAEVMMEDGHLVEASDFLEEIYKKASDYIPETDPVVPRSLLNLVPMFINTDPKRSFLYMTRCHRVLNEHHQPPLAKARFLSDLGRAYLLASHPDQSIHPLSEAIQIYRYENALTGAGAGSAFMRMAAAQVRLGQHQSADKSLQQAEVAFAANEHKLPGNTLRCALVRAEILIADGRVAEGMDMLKKELEGQEKLFPKQWYDLSETLYWCARLMMRLPYTPENAQRINSLGARCCAIWERTENIAFASTTWLALGDFQAANRKLVDAENSYRNAIALCTNMRSVDNFSKVSLLNNLGEILLRREQYQKAYDVLKRSEESLKVAKQMQIGAIVGIQPATEIYLYKRLAECTEKLGMREENRKYTDLIQSNF